MIDYQYIRLVEEILDEGTTVGDRTGTGRHGVFGRELRYRLTEGDVPVDTTRKINYDHGIHELIWMIRGDTDINYLKNNNVPIWNGWAVTEADIDKFVRKMLGAAADIPQVFDTARRDLIAKHLDKIGPMYGYNWRQNPSDTPDTLYPTETLAVEDIPSDKLTKYNQIYDEMVYFHKSGVEAGQVGGELPDRITFVKLKYFMECDQLGELMRGIKYRPFSSRHVVTAWIPNLIPFEDLSPVENVLIGRGALAACHAFFQFKVTPDKDGGIPWIDLKMTQRSADMMLGVPTNLVFYSVFLHLVAHVTGYRARDLIWSGGDCHVYKNHIADATIQVEREPIPFPKIWINPELKDLFAVTADDIRIEGYESNPAIRYPVSI